MSRTSYQVASRDLSRLFREGTLATLSDAELLDRFATHREAAAFEALVIRHEGMVRRVCLDILGNPADAADASQATFAILLRRGRSIRSREALASWLHRVAVRSARQVRSEAIRRQLAESVGSLVRSGWTSPILEPSSILAQAELQRALHDEIDRLPDRYRRPLILCGLEGLSLGEAAARLGWSEGSVRGRLARAKSQLRARLLRRGLAPAVVALAFEQLALPARAAVEIAAVSWAYSKIVGLVLALAATLTASALIEPPAAATPAPPPRPVAWLPPPQQEIPPPNGDRVAFQVRVVDPAGNPVPGARVYSIADPWSIPEPAGVATDGSIRFDRPEASFRQNFFSGNYQGGTTYAQVFAVADGFGIGWMALAPASIEGKVKMKPSYDLTVRLVEDFAVTGRIVGPGGRPVAGASVALDLVDAPESGRIDRAVEALRKLDLTAFSGYRDGKRDRWIGPHGLASARVFPPVVTDATGRYRIAGIGRDRKAGLTVSGPGIGSSSWKCLTVDGLDDTTRAVRDQNPRQPSRTGQAISKSEPSYLTGIYGSNAEVEVDSERTIAGRVRDARIGRPIVGQTVKVVASSNEFDSSGQTDHQGRYRVVRNDLDERVLLKTGGSVGNWSGSGPYLGVARELVDRSKAGETVVDFDLEPGMVVTGRVIDGSTGQPMPARDSDDCPTGYFRAGFVYYMPLASNARASGGDLGRYYQSLPINNNGPGDIVFTILQDGHFGAVVPPGPGVLMVEPFLTAGLSALFGPWNESRGIQRRHFQAHIVRRSPNDGAGPAVAGDEASFPGPFGPISLRKFVAYQVINPTPGQDLGNLTITVPKAPTRRLRLIAPNGEPVRGASITGVTEPERDKPVILNGDSIEILALDPVIPRDCVALSNDRRLCARFTIRGDSAEPVTITLQPTTSLGGRLLDLQGQPIANAQIFADYEINGSFGQAVFARILMPPPATTDADGRFVVRGLWPDLTARLTFSVERLSPNFRPTMVFYQPTALSSFRLRPAENRDMGEIRAEPRNP